MQFIEEARRHFKANRGVMAYCNTGGDRQPAHPWKSIDREKLFDLAVVKFTKDPSTFMALVTGKRSGISVIDIDCKPNKDGTTKNGMEAWNAMIAKHPGSIDDAVCARSRSGGLHYYFTYTPELKHGQEKLFKLNDETWADIDIRNDGGNIVVAPTPGYSWIRSIFDHPLTECPSWIIEWHKQSVAKPKKTRGPKKKSTKKQDQEIPLEKLTKLVLSIPKQHCESYDSWYKILMALYRVSHHNGYAEEGLALAHEFSKQNEEKYNPEEVESKWKSAFDLEGDIGLGTIIHYSLAREYAAVKEQFEKTAFKVRHPLQYCIKNEGHDIWSYSRSDFLNLHENVFCDCKNEDGETIRKPFVPMWLSDQEIRTYDEIAFDPPPMKPKGDTFNLFTGLHAQCLPEPPEDYMELIKPILEHQMIMVGHDKAAFEYFVNWCAHRVQFPGLRPKTALVFLGDQGVGKGIFWEWFGESIVGKEFYFGTAGMRDLTGHFNEGLMNRILIFLDETKAKDTFKDAAELKRLIDAPTIKVNKKYCPVIDLRNCAGWVFASNEKLINVEAGDRRYVIFNVTSEKKGDRNYFKELGKSLESEAVVSSYFKFLQNKDLSGFDPERDRPMTETYTDMQEASAPIEVSFIQWLMETDAFKSKVWLRAMKLKERFEDFKRSNSLRADLLASTNLFGQSMKRFFNSRRDSKGMLYHMDEDHVRMKLVKAGYSWFHKQEPSFY